MYCLFDGIARSQRIESGRGQRITRGVTKAAQRSKERSKEERKMENKTDCCNCIYWNPGEECCTISDFLEYDEEQYFETCPQYGRSKGESEAEE